MKATISTSAVAVAVTLALAGCALTRSASNPVGYSFDYQADNRESLGLVQVFDDGVQTYLQLPAAGDRDTRVLDEDGRSTTPVRNGAFLVVPGLHRTMTLERDEGVSHITMRDLKIARQFASKAPSFESSTPAKTAPAPESVAVPGAPEPEPTKDVSSQPAPPAARWDAPKPSSSSEEQQHLGELQAQINGVEVEIRALQKQIAAENAELAQARAMWAAEARGDIFLVHFANNSARPELSEQEIASIVGAGRSAAQLIIEGYTDAFYPNEAGANLARARAQNVADMLANGGIKREHMSIAFHAAGGFVRDNISDEGKAFNRRVAVTVRRAETFSSG